MPKLPHLNENECKTEISVWPQLCSFLKLETDSTCWNNANVNDNAVYFNLYCREHKKANLRYVYLKKKLFWNVSFMFPPLDFFPYLLFLRSYLVSEYKLVC